MERRLMANGGDVDEEEDGPTCPICLNTIEIFAVGLCNHPVCSECSTRLRILCEQKECPICRQDMPMVGRQYWPVH